MDIFSDRWALWLLIAAVSMAAIYIFAARAERAARAVFAEPGLHGPLGLGAGGRMRSLRRGLYVLAALLAALSIARPLGGLAGEDAKAGGMDVIVVVDVSLSMAAVEDGSARLERAREVLHGLIASTPNNRYALVTFSGEPTVVCPLTFDQETFFTILDTEGVQVSGPPGSALGDAVLAALTRFKPDEKVPRAILVVTDGENTTGTEPPAAAEAVREAGLKLHALGVGTTEGARIPISKDFFGTVTYKHDRQGNVVISRLDEDTLRSMAGAAGGRYFSASDAGAAGSLRQVLNEKSSRAVPTGMKGHREYGPALSLAAAGLLMAALLI